MSCTKLFEIFQANTEHSYQKQILVLCYVKMFPLHIWRRDDTKHTHRHIKFNIIEKYLLETSAMLNEWNSSIFLRTFYHIMYWGGSVHMKPSTHIYIRVNKTVFVLAFYINASKVLYKTIHGKSVKEISMKLAYLVKNSWFSLLIINMYGKIRSDVVGVQLKWDGL